MQQSEKFGAAHDDSDSELEEESLLETPLDKVEPYGLFKDTLLSTYFLAVATCSTKKLCLLTMECRTTARAAAALSKSHEDPQS